MEIKLCLNSLLLILSSYSEDLPAFTAFGSSQWISRIAMHTYALENPGFCLFESCHF